MTDVRSLAARCIEDGRENCARGLLLQALQVDSADLFTIHLLLLLTRRGELPGRVEELVGNIRERLPEGERRAAQERFITAEKLRQAGRVEEASRELIATAKELPSEPAASYCAGLALLRSSQASKALEVFQSSLAADPTFLPTRRILGVAAIEYGALRIAVEASAGIPTDSTEPAAERFPHEGKAREELKAVAFAVGALREAIRLQRSGELREAAMVLAPVLRTFPNCLLATRLLNSVMLKRGWLDLWQRWLPSYFEGEPLALEFAEALVFSESERHAEAHKGLGRVVAARGDDPNALCAHADTARSVGDRETLHADLEQVATHWPEFLEARAELAEIAFADGRLEAVLDLSAISAGAADEACLSEAYGEWAVARLELLRARTLRRRRQARTGPELPALSTRATASGRLLVERALCHLEREESGAAVAALLGAVAAGSSSEVLEGLSEDEVAVFKRTSQIRSAPGQLGLHLEVLVHLGNGDPEAAAALLGTEFDATLASGPLFARYAAILYAQDQPEQALALCSSGLQRGFVEVLATMCRCLVVAGEAAELRRLADAHPMEIEPLRAAIYLATRADDRDWAIESSWRLLELSPGHPEAIARLASAYEEGSAELRKLVAVVSCACPLDLASGRTRVWDDLAAESRAEVWRRFHEEAVLQAMDHTTLLAASLCLLGGGPILETCPDALVRYLALVRVGVVTTERLLEVMDGQVSKRIEELLNRLSSFETTTSLRSRSFQQRRTFLELGGGMARQWLQFRRESARRLW